LILILFYSFNLGISRLLRTELPHVSVPYEIKPTSKITVYISFFRILDGDTQCSEVTNTKHFLNLICS